MRFRALHLQAFGPFTDVSLDLSGGQQGLHIIYGPNEAGKSSALRAVRAALFGIHSRTNDNFLHDNKTLRVGGRIENLRGESIAFLRRKGNKNTLLNLDHDQHAPLASESLRPFLSGI